MLDGIRSIPNRKYVHQMKYWTVPASSAARLQRYAEEHGFYFDTVAKEKLDELRLTTNGQGQPKTLLDYIKEAKGAGTVGVTSKEFVIAFAKNPVLAEYAESIPGIRMKLAGLEYTATVPFAAARFLGRFIQRYDLKISDDATGKIEECMAAAETEVIVPDVDSPLPDGRRLFAHQKEDALRMARERRIIIGNEMGTGKTLTTLSAVKPFMVMTVIICPAGLKAMWEREARAVGLRRFYVTSWAKIPDAAGKDDEGGLFSNDPFSEPFALVADEAHYAQAGTATIRGKRYLALAEHPNCIASFPLTGTPMKNGKPENLFPLLKAIRHPLAINRAQYDRLYSGMNAYTQVQFDNSGKTNLDILHENIKDSIIQRKKAECLDLPEKMRVMFPVEDNSFVKHEYEKYLRQYLMEHRQRMMLEGKEDSPLAILMCERHAVSHAKVESTVELAKEILAEGRPVVVAPGFQDTAQRIAAKLGMVVPTSFMTGETNMRERDRMVQAFQNGEQKAFVMTIGVGGVGWTLTAASDIIMHDRPWTPGDAVQMEDRLHRISQHNAVTSYWMQYGMIDPDVDMLLQAKHGDITQTLDGERKELEFAMTREEMAEMLIKNFDYKKYLEAA